LDAVLSHTSPGPPPGAAAVVFADDVELEGVDAVLDGVAVVVVVGVDVAAGVEAVVVELVLVLVEGVVVVVLVEEVVLVDGVVFVVLVDVEVVVDDFVAPHQVFTPLWPTQAPILVDALE
jgi:hypothetical protein